MALNATGPISLGGTTIGQSIAKELCSSVSGTSQISMNCSTVRKLAGKCTAGSQITVGCFYGKSSVTVPGIPTIGAVASVGSYRASVSFTTPASNGGSTITCYQVICTATGTKTANGASSPITVTGLSASTSYTFKVRAKNAIGYGCYSGNATGSTAVATGSTTYSAGSFTWVAPAGVTSVSVVAVGSGAVGLGQCNGPGVSPTSWGGGGGALGYKNNYSVTPGSSYTVQAGRPRIAKYCQQSGQCSYFVNTSVVKGGAGLTYQSGSTLSSYTGDGGGSGGRSGRSSSTGFSSGGGGAGGYSGQGGCGGVCGNQGLGLGNNGNAGSGGAGGGGAATNLGSTLGGGGVGLYGSGCNGAAGVAASNGGNGGGGGSGGASGSTNAGGTFGGGLGGRYKQKCNYPCAQSGAGAVRIVWPGNTRTFPSTNVCASVEFGSTTFSSATNCVGLGSFNTASYSWVAPVGVTKVSVVAVGAGGSASCYYMGGGAGLGYKNNYSVTPGTSYTVVVGRPRTAGACRAGGTSYFVSTGVVYGSGGSSGSGGGYGGDGGGSGGSGAYCASGYNTTGGGGAGGYSGNGGNGGARGTTSSGNPGSSGSGGGGGGGAGYRGVLTYNPPCYCGCYGYYYAGSYYYAYQGSAGGGVGLCGQGSNGAGGNCSVGLGGSGGRNGCCNTGGNYGGGGYSGGYGAVRIVWPGCIRGFPSTCVSGN
jgi:hypothetical protein